MEIKKTAKADLEKKRLLFKQLGFIFALLLVLSAFEYKTFEKRNAAIILKSGDVIEEIMTPVTFQPKPLVPPQPPKQTAIIEIVKDATLVDETLIIDANVTATVEIPAVIAQQPDEERIVEPEIFRVAESMPEFPGGEAAMRSFLSTNIKYPPLARELGIQGKVYVNFVVETDGSITKLKLFRGIGGGCDEEALRVVRSMPKWTPGKQIGKAVRVEFTLPIHFKLR